MNVEGDLIMASEMITPEGVNFIPFAIELKDFKKVMLTLVLKLLKAIAQISIYAVENNIPRNLFPLK